MFPRIFFLFFALLNVCFIQSISGKLNKVMNAQSVPLLITA